MVAIFTGLGAGFERGSGAALGRNGLLGSSGLGRGGEGVFVNAANGNLVLTRQDEFLVGLGPDVVIARTYNSLGEIAHDDNGDLWRQSSDRRLYGLTGTQDTIGSTIKRLSGDGSEIGYEYGEWEEDVFYYRATDGAAAHDKLTYTAAAGAEPAYWTWTDGSTQITETYEASAVTSGNWRIKSQNDPDANTLAFAYVSASDRLHRVTTHDGSYIEYSWDVANNRITKIVTGYDDLATPAVETFTPTRTHYEYDASNRLIKVSVDFTPHDDVIGDNNVYWTSYTYDGSSQRIASITQKDGSKLEIGYDPTTHRVTSLVQTVATGDTRTTTINYQSGYTEITDPRGSVWKLHYETADADYLNQLIELEAPPPVIGGATLSTLFEYDDDGNVTRTTDGAGEHTDYTFDAHGNVATIIDANGNVTTRVYDARNNLVRETRTGSFDDGTSTQLHTRFVYDEENHLRFVINGEGEVTEHNYNADGLITRTIVYSAAAHTHALGATALTLADMTTWRAGLPANSLSSVSTTVFAYDARGNLSDTYRYGAADASNGEGIGEGDGGSGAGDGFSKLHFVYDQHGRLLKRQTNGQQAETYVYDELGRLILSTDLAGGTTSITFTDDPDLADPTKTDVVVTLATGFTYTTTSVYNKAGELKSFTDVHDSNSLVARGTETYDYDKNGQLRRMVDASGKKFYFIYDRMGRKVADINQLGDMVSYKYDDAGRVIATVRHANRVSTSHLTGSPNSLDLTPTWEVEVTESPQGGATTIRPATHAMDLWQFTIYDDAGRVIETVLGDGSVTTYAYDEADRLVGMRGYVNKLTSTQVNGFKATPPVAATLPDTHTGDAVTRTFYDRAGRVIGALNAEGYLSQTVYDEAGRKIHEIAFATPTNPSLRASGTFADLIDGLADAEADISQRLVYDGQGLLRYSVDTLNRVTEYVYWDSDDQGLATGLVRKTIVYATTLIQSLASSDYAAAKLVVDLLSETSARTSYNVYNDRAQLIFAIGAAGGVTGFAYDAGGRVKKTTRFAQTITMSEEGTMAEWEANLTSWAGFNGAGARITRNFHNSRGDLRYAVDAEGYLTQFNHDAESRIATELRYGKKLTDIITVSDTTTLLDVYNAPDKGDSRDTSYGYDAAGRRNSITDPTGHYQWLSYNANGTLLWDISGNWADNGRTLATEYDLAGRKIKETRYTSELANSASVGQTATQLNGGQRIESADGNYAAVLTNLGELELLHKGERIWAAGTRELVSGATYQLRAQTDGDLVLWRTVGGVDSMVTTIAAGDSGASFIKIDNEGEFSFNLGTAPTVTTEIWSIGSPPMVAIGSAGKFSETIYAYNGLGNVTTVTDPRGTVTTLTHDKLGRLTDTSVTVGSETITTSIDYDAFGQAVATTDGRGHTNYAYYDQAGRVDLAIDAEGYATSTTYNAFGEVETLTRRYNNTQGEPTLSARPEIDPHAALDAVTSYAYDALGRVSLVRDAEGYITHTTYTDFGEVETVKRFYNQSATLAAPTTHALDAETHFSYDQLGRAISTIDALNLEEDYTLNAYGERTSVYNKAEGQTDYVYDGRGLVVSETKTIQLPNAAEETIVNLFDYDSRGNLIRKREGYNAGTQAALRTTRYEYDKLDRLVRTFHDTQTNAVAATAISALTTVTPTEYFYYDRNGNLIEKRDPVGARTLYWYDAANRLTHQLSAAGTLTRHFYDKNGNVTETRVYAEIVALPANAQGSAPDPGTAYRVTLYGYDDNNRLKTVTVPNMQTAEYGSSFATTTDSLTTTYDYDARGNVVKTTDAAGRFVYAYFDRLNRKIAQVDAGNYRTDWTYNGDGNVLLETRYAATAGTITGTETPPASQSTSSENDRVTQFTYDTMGRRLTETRLNVKVFNPSTGLHTSVSAEIEYAYNALGQVLTKTEATGDTTSYVYDDAGRLRQEMRGTYLDHANDEVTPTVDYDYDGLGNLTLMRARGGDGSTTSATDQRETTYLYGIGGRLLSVEDAQGFVRTYRYDAAGRVTREEYVRATPTGSAEEAVGYTYDADGRVTRQGIVLKQAGAWTRDGATIDTVATLYNAFGEVSKRGFAHYTGGVETETVLYGEEFAYNQAGRLERSNAGDGVWKYFMYDEAGNQALMLASVGTDFTASAYDTLGEVLALWSSAAAIATTNVSGIAATITRYDARNQAILVFEPQRQLNSTTSADLRTSRAYNAFGDVIRETNALGHDGSGNPLASASIEYAYNTMGRLIRTESPAVEGVGENGKWITGYASEGGAPDATSATATTFRPVEHRYYDASGRLVAQRDANGYLTRHTLLAGTGYGGAQALITETFTPDSAVARVKYDIHGDARRIEDGLYLESAPDMRVTKQTFDKTGRLVEMWRAASATQSLTQYYAYDGLGQRIRHWNSLYGNGVETNVERTFYDHQGRIVQHFAMGGDETANVYAWDPTIATAGMGTFGGWTQTTTYENDKTVVDKGDVFGRTTSHINMAGLVGGFTYDKAGRLMQRSGGDAVNYTYFNTGRVATIASTTSGTTRTATYGYDQLGAVKTEQLVSGSQQWQNATASYDALGRLVSWNEAGSAYTPAASLTYTYDANGNIRSSNASFHAIDPQGNFAATPTTQNNAYRYDAMNRVIKQNGALLMYDAAGQRVSVSTTFEDSYMYNDPEVPGDQYHVPFTNEREEYYTYDAAGRLTQVSVAEGSYVADHPYYYYVEPGAGTVRGAFTYDDMGRMLSQTDYGGPGGQVHYSRTMTYNAKGQVVSDEGSTRQGADVFTSESTYSYGSGTGYALGAPLTIMTENWKNGNEEKTTLTTNTYTWAEGAQQDTVEFDSDYGGANPLNTSTFTYVTVGGQRQLASAYIIDGRATFWARWEGSGGFGHMGPGGRTVTFRIDLSGQVIRRDESDAHTTGDPHEVWHRFAGRQVGYVGNNGTSDVNYRDSTAERVAGTGSGPFRNGGWGGAHADFDQSIAPINSYYQGSMGGAYTVRAGDTLASIAASLWGDSSLWYKIAEVNGLSGASTLFEGQSLILPTGVMKSTHNASTFSPYDPTETLGDVSPTRPKPPKENKCGVFGQILLVVIAVVVTIYATEWAYEAWGAAISAWGAGAVGAATGSIVSQGVGVATGIQEEFSWNAVAIAAVSGGVSGGAGGGVGGAMAKNIGNTFVRAVVTGAINNAITQGVSVAMGWQKEFSWAGVAAAGVGAGVAESVLPSEALSSIGQNQGYLSGAYIAASVQRGTASALASAATRSLIEGSDFGDNIMAALPDVIGQTIGNAIAGRIAGGREPIAIKPVGGEDLPAPKWEPLDEVAELAQFRMVEDGESFSTMAGGDVERTLQFMEANPDIDPRLLRSGTFISVPSNGLVVSDGTRARYALSDSQYREYLAAQAARPAMPAAGKGGLNLGLASFTPDPDWNRAAQFQTYLGAHPVAQQVLAEGHRYADAIDRLVASDLPLETPWFDPINLAMYADLPYAGYSLLRAGARYGLERAIVGTGGEVGFSSGANLNRMALPRSLELGEVSTTAQILENGFIPGVQGVTLNQRSVVFADLARMTEMHGVEFALTKENGAWRLYSGGIDSVSTPLGANTRILAHTHPGGSQLPSGMDIRALNRNFDARLAVNPSVSPYPSRVIYGTGADDVTLFWPTTR